MTERDIQMTLYRRCFNGAKIMLPNFTPHGRYECDVWVVTKSWYVREYEIKVSRGDYAADRDKADKHANLSNGCFRGPCQFWYVCPQDVLRSSDMPEWAGLIYADDSVRGIEVKRAPRLHKHQVLASQLDQAREALYWRFWRERAAHDETRRQLAESQATLQRMRDG